MAQVSGPVDATLRSLLVDAYASGHLRHCTHVLGRSQRTTEALAGFAADHRNGPIFDVAEQVGSAEGLRAKLFVRRDRIWMRGDKAARSWSAEFALHAPTAHLAAAATSAVESTVDDRRRIKEAVLLILMAYLSQNHELSAAARSIVAAALAAGDAEGTVSGASLLALARGSALPDVEALFAATLKNLQNLDSYWTGVDAAVAAQVAGLAGDIGQTVATMLQSGATQAELESAITQILAGGDGAAFYLDQAIHAAYAAAQVAFYADQQVEWLAWTDIGDGGVCPACLANAAGSPYPIDNAPALPAHGACRCWWEPADNPQGT